MGRKPNRRKELQKARLQKRQAELDLRNRKWPGTRRDAFDKSVGPHLGLALRAGLANLFISRRR